MQVDAGGARGAEDVVIIAARPVRGAIAGVKFSYGRAAAAFLGDFTNPVKCEGRGAGCALRWVGKNDNLRSEAFRAIGMLRFWIRDDRG
jgi:hypothetical protein